MFYILPMLNNGRKTAYKELHDGIFQLYFFTTNTHKHGAKRRHTSIQNINNNRSKQHYQLLQISLQELSLRTSFAFQMGLILPISKSALISVIVRFFFNFQLFSLIFLRFARFIGIKEYLKLVIFLLILIYIQYPKFICLAVL